MVYSMPGFVESSIILQDIIMILMEICQILELDPVDFRIMSLVGEEKILVSTAELFFFRFYDGLFE